MNLRTTSRLWRMAFRSLAVLLLTVVTALSSGGTLHGQDGEEPPKPEKEWVIGYALAFLPMAGAMYFMFRMSKRQEFKLKKAEGEE